MYNIYHSVVRTLHSTSPSRTFISTPHLQYVKKQMASTTIKFSTSTKTIDTFNKLKKMSQRMALFYDELLPSKKVDLALYNYRLRWCMDINEFLNVTKEEMSSNNFIPNWETWKIFIYSFGRRSFETLPKPWTLAMHEAQVRQLMMEGQTAEAKRCIDDMTTATIITTTTPSSAIPTHSSSSSSSSSTTTTRFSNPTYTLNSTYAS